MKIRYKLKVLSIGGDLWYKPMYKKFLFWRAIPIINQFGKKDEYGTYENAEHAIEVFKDMRIRTKKKRMGSIPIE